MEIIGNGRVTGVRCMRMELVGFDNDGRRRPRPKSESEFVVPADMVIPAISQQADLPFLDRGEVQQTRKGSLAVDGDTQMTSLPGIFAHPGNSWKAIVNHLYLTSQGVYGIALGVVATYVFHYVLFGVLATRVGLGKLFIDLWVR